MILVTGGIFIIVLELWMGNILKLIHHYNQDLYITIIEDSFSVVLLAVVDAQLRFIYVDVGTNRRISDSETWSKCKL